MIELDRIAVHWGDFQLDDISFSIPTGGYGTLTGPTGAGKSTLLEIIAGLRRSHRGHVKLAGRDADGLRPAERNIGYVPQDGALFPTHSVEEHLAFALRVRRWSEERIRVRVGQLAARLGIAELLHRSPEKLSGGERQRVALGRALAFQPPILLLDEPMSSLDEPTRGEIGQLLRDVHRESRATVLHVTHHREEADRLGDVSLHLEQGRIHNSRNA